MTYFGGKTHLARRIAAVLPRHEHYVEPFAGSLAILLAKAPSRLETISDLDGDLMTFWRVLRERPAELERVCALTPHSRAEHQAAFDLPDDLDDLERARRVWVQLTQGRMGVRTRRTGWRCYVDPAGTSTAMPGLPRRIRRPDGRRRRPAAQRQPRVPARAATHRGLRPLPPAC
jgi:DNA adenine methylase